MKKETIQFTNLHPATKLNLLIYFISVVGLIFALNVYGFSWWAVSTLITISVFTGSAYAVDRTTLRLNPENTVNDMLEKIKDLQM